MSDAVDDAINREEDIQLEYWLHRQGKCKGQELCRFCDPNYEPLWSFEPSKTRKKGEK